MANLKKGRNADGSRRGSEVKGSLLARLFSRSSNNDDDDDSDTDVAPTPVRKPAPAAKPKPKEVLVAKADPKLPKAQSGPNVFASEASALKDNAAKAAEAELAAQIAADGKRALADKQAADLARASADATNASEEARQGCPGRGKSDRRIAARTSHPSPRRRPAQAAPESRHADGPRACGPGRSLVADATRPRHRAPCSPDPCVAAPSRRTRIDCASSGAADGVPAGQGAGTRHRDRIRSRGPRRLKTSHSKPLSKRVRWSLSYLVPPRRTVPPVPAYRFPNRNWPHSPTVW